MLIMCKMIADREVNHGLDRVELDALGID